MNSVLSNSAAVTLLKLPVLVLNHQSIDERD